MNIALTVAGIALVWVTIGTLLALGIGCAIHTADTFEATTVEEHADEAIAIVSQGQVHSQTWSNIDELQLRRWQREHRS